MIVKRQYNDGTLLLTLKPSVLDVKLPVSTVMIQENISILRVNGTRSSVQDLLYLVPIIVMLKLFLMKHKGEYQLELVSCPNNCGEKLKRQCLVTHIQTRYICRKVKCRYCNDLVY